MVPRKKDPPVQPVFTPRVGGEDTRAQGMQVDVLQWPAVGDRCWANAVCPRRGAGAC